MVVQCVTLLTSTSFLVIVYYYNGGRRSSEKMKPGYSHDNAIVVYHRASFDCSDQGISVL